MRSSTMANERLQPSRKGQPSLTNNMVPLRRFQPMGKSSRSRMSGLDSNKSGLSNLDFDNVASQDVKQLLAAKLDQQKKYLEKHHTIEIKNLRRMFTQEAKEFIRKQSGDIQKTLSK